MRQRTTKLLLILLTIGTSLRGQDSEIDLLVKGELKMTFPSIYFKHNSTDYATVPYAADSCLKYIAAHIKDIKSFIVWRDSSETDLLTNNRIENLKVDLNKYTPSDKINIQPMGNAQKISRRTIHKGADNEQIQYLISLNSVFDIYTTGVPTEKKKKSGKVSHIERPRIWCLNCWRGDRFSKGYRQVNKKRKSGTNTSVDK